MNGNAAVTHSDAAGDAPPPLEAPPIERSDSLPPLEAVDERIEAVLSGSSMHPSTACGGGGESNPLDAPSASATAPATAADTAASSATAADTTAQSAPSTDLRALINKLAPIPINNAATTTTTPTHPPTTQPPASPFMTLDDWRKLSQTRPELSMRVLGEPSDRKKKERGLTGMGGGWKGTEGWKCESLHCSQFENKKYDTVCARCGAVRRFQRA